MSIAPQKWVSNLANQANAHTHTHGRFQSAGAARSLSFNGKLAECNNNIQDCTVKEIFKKTFHSEAVT